MSGRAVARGVVTLMAAGLLLGAPARANDAAHKMAEKFAGPANGADANKPADAKQQDKDKAEAAKKRTPSAKRRKPRSAPPSKRR